MGKTKIVYATIAAMILISSIVFIVWLSGGMGMVKLSIWYQLLVVGAGCFLSFVAFHFSRKTMEEVDILKPRRPIFFGFDMLQLFLAVMFTGACISFWIYFAVQYDLHFVAPVLSLPWFPMFLVTGIIGMIIVRFYDKKREKRMHMQK